jgi:hypothetical protein
MLLVVVRLITLRYFKFWQLLAARLKLRCGYWLFNSSRRGAVKVFKLA